MADVEGRVRRLLAGQAASVTAGGDIPPEVVVRVRRRRRARATGAALAAVLAVVVGAGVLLRPTDTDDDRLVAGAGPTPTVDEPRPADPGVLPGVLGFVANTLVDLSVSPPAELAELSGGSVENGAVQTPFGVVAMVSDAGEPGTVWVVPSPPGAPRRLAEDVAGFAVAADGETVAWSSVSQSVSGSLSQLVVARLPDGVERATTTVRYFARVAGFAGDAVVIETGDGADTAAAIWIPGGALHRSPFADDGPHFGSVAATDPARGRAVLNQGDGLCGTLVDVGSDGTVRPATDLAPMLGCEGRALAFSPDGTLVASGRQQPPAGPAIASVHSVSSGEELARFEVEGELTQLRWLDRTTLLAVGRDWRGGPYWVLRCEVPGGRCASVLSHPGSIVVALPATP